MSPIHGDIASLLVAIVRELPDATVAELTEVLEARSDVTTSRSAVQRALVRLGYSRKKKPSSRSSARRPSTANGAVPSARS